MKKITSILILICTFACSSYVFGHENVMKKPVGIDNVNYSFEQNATVVSFNYEVLGDEATSFSFKPYVLKDYKIPALKNSLNSLDEDVSHILILNISNDYLKNIKSNITYALAPNRLCIEIMRKRYPYISATPLPKHYLLPAKNITWQFGSNQYNC